MPRDRLLLSGVINSLKTFDALTAAHLPEPQARAIVQVIGSALETDNQQRAKYLATKVDADKFDLAMLKLEAKLEQMEASLKAEMAGIRADIARLVPRTDSSIYNAKTEILRWMFAFWASQFAATVAIIFSATKQLK